MKPLISVIVPAYNIEKYIGDCLDSLLAQTYRDLEILIVDDGSTDSTGDLAEEYAKKDDRIRVIHQENRGLSGARNAALPLTKGEWIGFVDGDDRIEKDMYESMIGEAFREDADIALCAYRAVYDGKNDPGDSGFSGKIFVLDREEALDAFVCDNRSFHIYYSVWSKLFKKEKIRDLSFPEGRNSEDILFSTKALLNAGRAVFIDRPLYLYAAARPDSIMNVRLSARRFEDEIPFLREQTALFYESGRKLLGDKSAYYFYRRMMFYYIDFRKRKMKEDARRLYLDVRKDKEKIESLCREPFAKKGDVARMRLFLFSPGLYYRTAEIYDRTVVPLKARDRGKR